MAAKVFFIRTGDNEPVDGISAKLRRLIDASNVLAPFGTNGFVAIKTHFGDVGNTGHIRWEWVREAALMLAKRTPNAFVADANVIYKMGRRANSVEHLRLADEHGFNIGNLGVPVLIADGLKGMNYDEVEVAGKHHAAVKIASDFARSDGLLVMSHMTGHILTGIGCAIKNVGMGCAARRGKYEQHCGAHPDVKASECSGCGLCVRICPAGCLSLVSGRIAFDMKACIGCGECAVVCPTRALEIRWSESLEILQQKMVEYAAGAIKAVGGRAGYINFLTRVTRDCDCLAKDDPSIVADIGILASSDPVAIDKASVDLVLKEAGRDVFKEGYPETDWSVQLKYAEGFGLGSLDYDLETVR